MSCRNIIHDKDSKHCFQCGKMLKIYLICKCCGKNYHEVDAVFCTKCGNKLKRE